MTRPAPHPDAAPAAVAYPRRRPTFRVLGPVRIGPPGAPTAPTAGKIRCLLAVLLVSTNRTVPTRTLLAELWGEDPPPTALDALHVYVSHLRRQLPPHARPWLVTEPSGYRLDADGEVDLHRFEHGLHAGRRLLAAGAFDQAAVALRGALDLWRGEALADVDGGPTLTAAAARADELRTTAHHHYVDTIMSAGRHDEAVAELRPLVAAQPLHEPFHTQLLLALYRSGRQADALATYQRLRTRLADHLGVDPAPELRQLHAAVLRADPHLDLPAHTTSHRGPPPHARNPSAP